MMTGQRFGTHLRLDPTESAADLMAVPLLTVRADIDDRPLAGRVAGACQPSELAAGQASLF